MSVTRRTLLSGVAAAVTLTGTTQPAAAARAGVRYRWGDRDPQEILMVWPGVAPGGDGVQVREEIVAREHPEGLPDRIARSVTQPQLTIFRPRRPNGAGVLIMPGGGYRHVVIDKEGFEYARWLNTRGVTAAVLRYRLPADGWRAGPDAPLQDAQRALRLMRGAASSLQIDRQRVGAIGFSAGGHLAARLLTEFGHATYDPIDERDALSARPDFGLLAYPVILMNGELTHAGSRELLLGATASDEQLHRYSADRQVTAATPPTALLHAADDTVVPVENSLAMFTALRRAGVASELHVFEEGGHGFGLRGIDSLPVANWPELMLRWLARHGFVPAEA